MENERSIEYYDSRVRDVKLEDITSCEFNARAFRKLRDNDPKYTSISFTNDDNADIYDVLIEDNDDMGWLGYLIGRNSHLKDLYIWPWLEDIDDSRIDALFQGINLNRSISRLHIYPGWGGFFLQRLSNFFRSNKNLTQIGLLTSDIGLETARQLAVDLRDMSLESFLIERLCYDDDSDSFIDDGAVTAEVIAALSAHNNIKCLDLRTCNLDRSACLVLGKLRSLKELTIIDSNVDAEGMKALAGVFCCLECLELSHMDIDIVQEVVAVSSGLLSLKKLSLRNSISEDGLHRLVAAMTNNTALEVLDLSQNTSITAKGLSSLSSLLQSEKCCLRELVLHNMHIGDDGAVALAEALVGNKSLKCLTFYESSTPSGHVKATGMTTAGWSAFTRLLCDKSSINNTYLSNHTLERCNTAYDDRMTSSDFGYYLSVNKKQQYAAMYKILENHSDFDMKPLFQWQLKFLPLMVAWFKTARARCPYWRESVDGFQRREFSAILQFVRGLPLLTVAGWRIQKRTGTDSKRRKLDHL